MRTLAWSNGERSTIIQWRDDSDPQVHLFCNLGWIPIGNTPDDAESALLFALDYAEGNNLEPVARAEAYWLAGVDPDESHMENA